jgi:hypothetical protein
MATAGTCTFDSVSPALPVTIWLKIPRSPGRAIHLTVATRMETMMKADHILDIAMHENKQNNFTTFAAQKIVIIVWVYKQG